MDMAHDFDQRTPDTDQRPARGLATLSKTDDLARLSRAETEQVAALIRAGKKANTLAAYQSDLRQVAAWLLTDKPALAAQVVATETVGKETRAHLCGPLPVEAVLAYIVAKQDSLAYPSLRRHIASLSTFHGLNGAPNPCRHQQVRDTLKGVRRKQQHEPKRAAAMRREHLQQVIWAVHYEHERGINPLAAKRDRALLLVGWAGALRRSELAALTWGQVENVSAGLQLTLRLAKTDDADEGQLVAIPLQPTDWLCPVRALAAWRSACMALGVDMTSDEGKALPVFCPIGQRDTPRLGRTLSGKSVGEIVKKRAALAGYDWDQFTAHSLRAGLITEAHEKGRSQVDIMATSRHKSPDVFATYVRPSDAMQRAASKGLL
jgi:integrase